MATRTHRQRLAPWLLLCLLFGVGPGCSCDDDTTVSQVEDDDTGDDGGSDTSADVSDDSCDDCGDTGEPDARTDTGTDSTDTEPDVPAPLCALDARCDTPHVVLAHDFDEAMSLVAGECASGECEGSCPTTVAGRVGNGASFDGSGGLVFETFGDSGLAAFTIQVWVNQTEACSEDSIIVGGGSPISQVWDVGCSAETGRITMTIAQSDGRQTTLVEGPELAGSGWRHVVVTRDALSGLVTLFVDGRRVGDTPTGLTGSSFLPERLYIGAGPLAANGFVGEIDEVLVVDRAQSQAEIELAAFGAAPERGICAASCGEQGCGGGVCSGLVRELTLDESEPPFADSTGAEDATCDGVCPTESEGLWGSAQTFDGATTGLSTPPSSDIDFGPTIGFTWTAWVRGIDGVTCSNPMVATDEVVLGRGGDRAGASWRLGCFQGTGRPLFELCDRFGDCFGLLGTETMIDGRWHLLSARFSPDDMSLSLDIDGQTVDRRPAPIRTLIDGDSSVVRIGWYGDRLGSHFAGDIDHVQLHRRRLSDPEIRSIASARETEVAPCDVRVESATLRLSAEALNTAGFVYGDLGAFAVSQTHPRNFELPPGTYNIDTFSTGRDLRFVCDAEIVQPGRQQITLEPGSHVECDLVGGLDRSCAPGITHLIALDQADVGDLISTADSLCVGLCPTPTDSPLEGAGHFDGGYVSLRSNTADWDQRDSFSIEYWIRKQPDSPLTENQTAVGRAGVQTDLEWWTGIWASNDRAGHIAFSLLGPNGEGSQETILTSASNVVDGRWHHVAAVRNADEHRMRLYIDGALEASGDFVFETSFADTSEVDIGGLAGGNQLNGDLDEVSIYRRALSAAEIRFHAITGPAGVLACRP